MNNEIDKTKIDWDDPGVEHGYIPIAKGSEPKTTLEQLKQGLAWMHGVWLADDATLPDGFRFAFQALKEFASLHSGEAGWRPTHRHYKGGLYRELMRGTFESSMTPVVVYQNSEGRVWVRPVSEFDGMVPTNDFEQEQERFERLPGLIVSAGNC